MGCVRIAHARRFLVCSKRKGSYPSFFVFSNMRHTKGNGGQPGKYRMAGGLLFLFWCKQNSHKEERGNALVRIAGTARQVSAPRVLDAPQGERCAPSALRRRPAGEVWRLPAQLIANQRDSPRDAFVLVRRACKPGARLAQRFGLQHKSRRDQPCGRNDRWSAPLKPLRLP